MKPVTGPDGDNPITDEQIRDLKADLDAEISGLQPWPASYRDSVRINHLRLHCRVALGEKVARPGCTRAQSRRVCADAWNDRHTKETP